MQYMTHSPRFSAGFPDPAHSYGRRSEAGVTKGVTDGGAR
jgi:hypothetical protein